MEIRTVGQKIQLRRSVYIPVEKIDGNIVPGTGRNKTKMLGSISSWQDTLPAELWATLTQEEQQQWSNWIDDKKAKDKKSTLDIAFRSATRYMDNIADNIQDMAPSQADIDNLLTSVLKLKKSLKNAKYDVPSEALLRKKIIADQKAKQGELFK